MRKEEASVTRFNNLVINRHSVVHEAVCNVTFEELQSSIPSVKYVCESLEKSLSGV